MSNERGALLLEVLAALTIFGVAALSAIGLLRQATDSEQRASAHEIRLADMDRLLAAHSLLRREELDQRLGTRINGPYLVEVQRPRPDLYRIAIGDSSVIDLATLVYRPRREAR